MTDRLDDLLRALPAPAPDHSLDQLEPAVWRRIQAQRASEASAGGSLRFQLVAAGMALGIGLLLGWSSSNAHRPDDIQALYASYAELGPMARLESGL